MGNVVTIKNEQGSQILAMRVVDNGTLAVDSQATNVNPIISPVTGSVSPGPVDVSATQENAAAMNNDGSLDKNILPSQSMSVALREGAKIELMLLPDDEEVERRKEEKRLLAESKLEDKKLQEKKPYAENTKTVEETKKVEAAKKHPQV